MNKCIILLLTALLFLNIQSANCQVRDTQPRRTVPVVPKTTDTVIKPTDSIINKRKADSLASLRAIRKRAQILDSVKNKRRIDSMARLIIPIGITDSNKTDSTITVAAPVQQPVQRKPVLNDSLQNDSINLAAIADSISVPDIPHYQTSISHKWLLQNRFINIKQAPVYFLQLERKVNGKEILFYSICILIFFLGLFKTIFYNYFNNLFRVFFNTSLRQSQLTDQLVQAKLPSFILNILFVMSAGIYAWLLFTHLSPQRVVSTNLLLPFCIGTIAIIYLGKYLIIKFMGWVGGIQPTTNNYIFIIFLVNKIIGILLIPFIILLAFSNPAWIGTISTISFLLLGLFFLVRYAKSYSSMDNKLRLNAFHFVVYIIGGEILPLLILYKLAVDYVL